MLICGHDRDPAAEPICSHLRVEREQHLGYYRLYTGSGVDTELLCKLCMEEREKGGSVKAESVCKECFELTIVNIHDLDGIRGKPEVRIRSEPFNPHLRRTTLPKEVGKIIDIAPIVLEGHSIWLMLADDGLITQFDANTGAWKNLARASLAPEPEHKPWNGKILKRRLHASPCGSFAAVVHDYGRYGQIIDLRFRQSDVAPRRRHLPS